MGTIDFSSIPNLLKSQAESSPEALALLAPEHAPFTYRQLNEQIAFINARLNALGIGRKDRLAIVLPNGPEMAVAFLGISCSAISAPLNPAYSKSEFDFYLSDLNAKAVVVLAGVISPAIEVARSRDIPIIEIVPSIDKTKGHFALVGDTAELKTSESPARPDDVALVLHTSGTTSRPKIVPLTHRNLCASAQSIRQSLQLTPRDRCLNVMPLFHIHGLVAALLASLSAGASVVCTPGFIAPQFFTWLDAFHPTWYTAVPAMHQAILARASTNREVLSGAKLRFVRSCSASLPTQLMDQMERMYGVPVIEAYGMTEASHQMTSNPLPPGTRKPGSVGISAGSEVAIMAEDGDHLLLAMQSGEIVIRGPNVMHGYANNPDSNAKAFTKGWFRTGDHGHIDNEGYLFITGRLKEIINRGGEKISPGEVEAVLLDHPGVAQAVAFAMPDADLGENVAAAVILTQPRVTEKELRRFASLHLSPFKVPHRILILDEIPKGPTGKIQRIGLAEKLGLISEQVLPTPVPGMFISPGTNIEKMLAEMWSDVLGLKRVSLHQRFLDLGGDSILATLLVTRICQSFNINLTLLDFFDAPTIAEQAITIEGLLLDEIEAFSDHDAGRENTREKRQDKPFDHADLAQRRSMLSPANLSLLGQRLKGNRENDALIRTIPCLSDRTDAPLSFSQQRLWFSHQWNPEIATFNRPTAFHLKGDLDLISLERSLNEILRRHEILRTAFPTSDGQPVQRIGEIVDVSLSIEDLTYLSPVDRLAMAQQLMIEMLQLPFVLESGPLYRVGLYRLDADDHIFIFVTHHILFDGWSEVVFVNELCALYNSFWSNNPVTQPDLLIQYADFAAWQKEMVHDETLKVQLAYWQKELAGPLPILDLPTDRHRPPLQTYRGSTKSLVLSAPSVVRLETISRQEGVTIFMTLLAGFKVVLYRYTGQTDIIVGTPVAGRRQPETENLIGVFVNTLALRTNLGGDPTFLELLRRIRQTCLDAYTHQDLPFDMLVVELNPERDLGRTPIFQVVFNLENLPERARTSGNLEVAPVDLQSSVALLDLSVELSRKDGEIHCSFIYNSDLFEVITIQRMVMHFQTLLEGIVADPGQRISDLPLLASEELHQLLVEWNETQVEYPRDQSVHQLFEAQVERTPESIAVVFEDRAFTYRELNQKANQLAHDLR